MSDHSSPGGLAQQPVRPCGHEPHNVECNRVTHARELQPDDHRATSAPMLRGVIETLHARAAGCPASQGGC